jgi:hypothetical protein
VLDIVLKSNSVPPNVFFDRLMGTTNDTLVCAQI